MKDYYYILGLTKTSSTEEVKKAYRKLSLKFHPDKNGGDEFFTERFKEIQEAYETLIDTAKRKVYDEKDNSPSFKQNNNGYNFNPEIEYFKANKTAFEFEEAITFSWKTINADKVIIKPFGNLPPIGQKTYRIKDFKNPSMTFELIAENSNIGRQIKTSINLQNKTYYELYKHFKTAIETNNTRGNTSNTKQKTKEEAEKEREIFEEENKTGDLITKMMGWGLVGLISLLIIIAVSNQGK